MFTEEFERDLLQEAVHGEHVELVRVLVPMNFAQASFHTLCLPVISCLFQLHRTVPPSITHDASTTHDDLVELALTS